MSLSLPSVDSRSSRARYIRSAAANRRVTAQRCLGTCAERFVRSCQLAQRAVQSSKAHQAVPRPVQHKAHRSAGALLYRGGDELRLTAIPMRGHDEAPCDTVGDLAAKVTAHQMNARVNAGRTSR